MDAFRYAQMCPLARAAEVLGHRWVLLIVRDLWLGPQRFADLKARLRGVSTSVLSERLATLEVQGIVRRKTLPPPAASRVYELTEDGLALKPVLMELTRWGLRRILPPHEGDHVEPEWFRLAVETFGVARATPSLRYAFEVRSGERSAQVCFAGGPDGVRLLDPDAATDVRVRVDTFQALALASGLLTPADALANGASVEGDAAALDQLPKLFHFDFGAPAS